ncbi:MAG: hypothetical protein H0U73_09635 [Tatlockia sp.]|nr:hypothetical protein [Tatlockia sp.]
MVKALTQILEYTNSDILKRYELDYALNSLSPKEAFNELMKFLWLLQKHGAEKALSPENEQLDFVCGIPEEIDDMWHTFLLFTKEYMEFCTESFGEFIHHAPTSDTERLTIDISQSHFARYLNYVRDNLGEETSSKWFNISL